VQPLGSRSTRRYQEEIKSIFDEELKTSFNDNEIRSNLEQLTPASGLDENYLKQQCDMHYEKIKEPASEQEDVFSNARKALENANNAVIFYKPSTSPNVLRMGILLSMCLIIIAFVRSHIGPDDATINMPLIFVVACLIFVTAVWPIVSRAFVHMPWISYRAQAIILSIAIGSFWAAILSIHIVHNVHVHSKPSVLVLYIFWLIYIPITSVPFLRVYARASSRVTVLLRSDMQSAGLVALGFIVMPLSSLLAGSRSAVMTTVRPSAWLIGLAAAIGVITLIFALGGITKQPLSVLNNEYDEAKKQLRSALYTQAILPYLRTIISERQPSDSNLLVVPEAAGLSEQFDPIFEVGTASRSRIGQILKRLPTGGSLGLAGPRGSGKSTLLKSFCGEHRQNPDDSLPVLLSAPVEYSSREFLLHLYATLCRNILKQSKSGWNQSEMLHLAQGRRHVIGLTLYAFVLFVAGSFLIILQVNGVDLSTAQLWGAAILLIGAGFLVQAFMRRRPSGIILSSSSSQAASLEAAAAARLEEIRFQQTISATWSGTFNAPLGFAGTFGGGQNLARQALLLPEIVDSLREFLETASLHKRIIIGIDELDKMESDEHAKQFLNEIKGIFGARGCYFIVSVSEDAIGSFERRGIPFRDVFDSSFDEVVQVRCLTFTEAEAVLNRRVTRMPVKFKQLCYCLSGGISRDLIRAARSAVEASVETTDPNLKTITNIVLARDLRGKAEAISAAMSVIDIEPQVSEVLLWVRHMDLANLTSDSIQAEMGHLEQIMLSPVRGNTCYERDVLLLRRLTTEFAGYCYYIGTLLDIFANRQATASVPTYKYDYQLDDLVANRQLFTVNTLLAWKEISGYRENHQLSTVAAPSILQDELKLSRQS